MHQNNAKPLTLFAILSVHLLSFGSIEISTTLEDLSHYYDYDDFFDQTTVSTNLADNTAPSFIYDFSALGETLLQFQWKAPTDQKVVVTAPDGYSLTVRFIATAGGNTVFPGAFQDSNPTYAFTDFQGTEDIAQKYNILTGPGGNVVSFRLILNVAASETISFTSLTVESTVPASYAESFNYANLSAYSVTADLSPSPTGEIADPGPFISLQSIPEPAVSALIAGLLVIGFVLRVKRRK